MASVLGPTQLALRYARVTIICASTAVVIMLQRKKTALSELKKERSLSQTPGSLLLLLKAILSALKKVKAILTDSFRLRPSEVIFHTPILHGPQFGSFATRQHHSELDSPQDLDLGNKFRALESAIRDINSRMDKMFKLIDETVESNKAFRELVQILISRTSK